MSNDVEAFEPPYLFRGIRPRIDAISTTALLNGASFQLNVSRTDSVTSVVLVGTNAVTHWVDAGVPRVLRLPFEQTGGTLNVAVPTDQSVAPVGYYILFTMVDDIPSSGVIVRVLPSGSAEVPGGTGPLDALSIRIQPNPSRESARISWHQATAGDVRLKLFDLGGRAVFSISRRENAGWLNLSWDGTGSAGKPVHPGLYLLQVESADGRRTAKVARIAR